MNTCLPPTECLCPSSCHTTLVWSQLAHLLCRAVRISLYVHPALEENCSGQLLYWIISGPQHPAEAWHMAVNTAGWVVGRWSTAEAKSSSRPWNTLLPGPKFPGLLTLCPVPLWTAFGKGNEGRSEWKGQVNGGCLAYFLCWPQEWPSVRPASSNTGPISGKSPSSHHHFPSLDINLMMPGEQSNQSTFTSLKKLLLEALICN